MALIKKIAERANALLQAGKGAIDRHLGLATTIWRRSVAAELLEFGFSNLEISANEGEPAITIDT